MSLMIAALLVSAQAATDQPAAPAPATTAAAPAPKKERKICKVDETSGTRMARRLCLTQQEWSQRTGGNIEGSRSGVSGTARDQ